MSSDLSVLGNIRTLLHLPCKLDKAKAKILEAERDTPNRIGTWKCICGHKNAIYHHRPPALHPLGFMSCRVCPLIWHRNLGFEITSQTTGILIQGIQLTDSGHTQVLSIPPNSSTSYEYICLGLNCGLTWRTEIKPEWFSGRRRHVLLIDGKRGKRHCACGMKIFQVGRYAVFEVV
jgi:hypothetical protein